MENPEPEFTELENFFGFENELEFKFNGEKGLPCLSRPVPYCLSASKGRTRASGKSSTKPDVLVPHVMTIIRNSYRGEMENLFHLIYPDLEMQEFCQKAKPTRFSWLKEFLCSGNVK